MNGGYSLRGIPFGATGNTAGGSAFQALALRDGATSYYRLGDAVGSTVMRDELNINHGVYHGAPTLGVAGLLARDSNTAVIFPTLADFGSVLSAAALNLGDGPFSIELLLKRTGSFGQNAVLLQKGNTAYGVGFDNPLNFLKLSRTGDRALVQSTVAILDGLKHHCVITRVGAGAGLTLIYIDGVEGHTDIFPAVGLLDTGNPLTIGVEPAFAGFDGVQDEVVFYKNTILTPAQVFAHFQVAT